MKTDNKINFTKKALEVLPLPPQGKRFYYYDTKVRALIISVTSKGTKTFYVYRKVKGRPERIMLGYYPDLSVENARGQASSINSQISLGKNPNREKSKLKAELTFGELFERYLEGHAKLHKKSWKNDENIYRLYLSHLKKRKISSFHKADFEALHSNVGKVNGVYAANRMLALLGVMFNKAMDWGWDGKSPVEGIKKFKEKSRERFLQGEELSRFFQALAKEPNKLFTDFFMVCLLTGARKGNVLSMRWQDVDLNKETWNIPETKNGESHLIPLSSDIIKILRQRHIYKENDWVFPSKTSQSGHLEEPKRVWKRILEEANLTDLRLHDLRRTLGSWQAATGANSYVIGKSLGHKTQQATAIYARLNIDPVRESVNRATSAMLMNVTEEGRSK